MINVKYLQIAYTCFTLPCLSFLTGALLGCWSPTLKTFKKALQTMHLANSLSYHTLHMHDHIYFQDLATILIHFGIDHDGLMSESL